MILKCMETKGKLEDGRKLEVLESKQGRTSKLYESYEPCKISGNNWRKTKHKECRFQFRNGIRPCRFVICREQKWTFNRRVENGDTKRGVEEDETKPRNRLTSNSKKIFSEASYLFRLWYLLNVTSLSRSTNFILVLLISKWKLFCQYLPLVVI